MKLLSALFFLLVGLTAFAQPQFQQRYGGELNERGHDLIQTSDGGFLLACVKSDDPATVQTDSILLIKIHHFGGVQWELTLEGRAYEEHTIKVEQHPAGGYYVIATHNDIQVKQDLVVHKVSANGELEWSKITERELAKIGVAGSMMLNDGSIMLACTLDSATLNPKVVAIKLDASGNEIWWKRVAGNAQATAISQSYLGSSVFRGIITGKFLGGPAEERTMLRWVKETGEVQDTIFRLPSSGGGLSLARSHQGFTYVLTKNQSAVSDSNSYKLLEVDGQGIVLDQYYVNPHTPWLAAKPMLVTSNLDLLIGGTARQPDPFDWYKGLIQSRSSDGDVNWQAVFGYPYNDYVQEMVETTSGGIAAIGYCYGSQFGNEQVLFISAGSDGSVTIEKIRGQRASNWSLYPNPSSGILHLSCETEQFPVGTATLFDLQGRKLAEWPVSSSTETLSVEEVPNGIYVLQIHTDNNLSNIKLCVRK